ncbi:hypothetical protein Pint_27199 [Pistacia integerrima]|uniref:Uncharacterized protein n=1 Tax=Pistacia integerrima TaxID=434235 RepID=A0ACC0YS70_9ROSI|nr:hypothetical protein Pint_27199 [Pistacia integerrima]
MLRKNPNLVCVKNDNGLIPIVVASLYGSKDMVRYLYSKTPIEILSPENNDRSGATLLNCLITDGIYDVALNLLKKYPLLGVTEDFHRNYAIKLLAHKPSAFPSGQKFIFWKQWIYSCMCVKQSGIIHHHDDEWPPKKFGDDEESNIIRSQECSSYSNCLLRQVRSLFIGLIWKLLTCFVPDMKHIYHTKLRHAQVLELLNCILKEILKLSNTQLERIGFDQAIYDAIKHGIIEIVDELIECNPEIIWRKDKKGRTIFANALVLRQEKIFSHEVQSMVPPKYMEEVNENNKTPSALFSEEHQELVREGERWMKNTAASCMVVATLIAAVMFTSAFTVPGGDDNETGFPIFLKYDAFLVFVISNAFALFASSTAVLVFLGILTSRYEERDFLKSSPTKLIIGLFSLFFSIVTMMVAFGSALSIVLQARLKWVAIPVIVLSSIPVVFFALLQFPLLVEMVICTYWRDIFDKPKKGSMLEDN